MDYMSKPGLAVPATNVCGKAQTVLRIAYIIIQVYGLYDSTRSSHMLRKQPSPRCSVARCPGPTPRHLVRNMPRRRLMLRDRPCAPTARRVARRRVDDDTRTRARAAPRRVQRVRPLERSREPCVHGRVRHRAREHERAVGRLRGHRDVERAFRSREHEREGAAGARGGARRGLPARRCPRSW